MDPPLVFGIILSKGPAIVAALAVVLVVIILWKFLKLAFRLAVIAAAAFLIWLILRQAGVL